MNNNNAVDRDQSIEARYQSCKCNDFELSKMLGILYIHTCFMGHATALHAKI